MILKGTGVTSGGGGDIPANAMEIDGEPWEIDSEYLTIN
jgi:hypothetical protein